MTRCVAPVLFLLLLSACLVTTQEQVSEGRLTVAFIPKSFTDPFWLDAIAGAERAAGELELSCWWAVPRMKLKSWNRYRSWKT